MGKITFDQFFESLLEREEFITAFKQVSPSEQTGVKDVAETLFRHFEISERGLACAYIDGVCETVAKNGSMGSISVIETALCDAGRILPRKYTLAANA